MKTQISNLRSGTKNQILNAGIDYSKLPKATSHEGHSGSSQLEVGRVWESVKIENPESINVVVKGISVELKANWSLSKKSVNYTGSISKDDLEKKFNLKSSKTADAYISIQHGNVIVISNGKNIYTHLCPSLIEIV